MGELASQFETGPEVKRVVLLGASNLSRGFPALVRSAKQWLGCPLEFLVAMGYGRSYGQESSFFGKKFCGILQSPLWEHLEQNGHVPTYALITDIGNDILYGVSVETILQWIAESLERLHKRGAQVVMTNMPIDSIHGLGRARFLLFRTFFFPACRLSLETVVARAEMLSQALQDLAKDKKVPVLKAKSKWYGMDPIHVRRTDAVRVWTEILKHWTDLAAPPAHHRSPPSPVFSADYFYLATASFRSMIRHPNQPIDCLCDGVTIAQF